MMKRLRPILILAILAITIGVFIWYIGSHPEVIHQLRRTSLSVIITLLLLYGAGIIALAAITLATLRLCRVNIPWGESALLTAYSSVINFFGPLQSGPAFRAVYLKTKHNVILKNYATATLVYYFFYGALSGLMLLTGLIHWWIAVLMLAGSFASIGLLRSSAFKNRFKNIDLHGWYYLALATFFQIAIVTGIYYRELTAIHSGISFTQAVIYTGAANLSLFVSITPGAIGFRESFLVFSQRLHHVGSDVIVTASILDRAVYIILLGLLALLIFGTHAKQYISLKKQ